MKLMVLPFALLCATVSAQAQTVSKIAFTESRHTVNAYSRSGPVALSVIRCQLDIQYPAGRRERGDLVVGYEPLNGHYFWRYTPVKGPFDTASFLSVLESGLEAVYAGPDSLVDFYMPGQLYVGDHPERADGLDAAQDASIADIQRSLAKLEKSGFHADSKEVAVARAIGWQFSREPLDGLPRVNCGFAAKSIVSIRREGDKWRLVVRNRWDQEVILDSKFNLVSTQRLPEPLKE